MIELLEQLLIEDSEEDFEDSLKPASDEDAIARIKQAVATGDDVAKAMCDRLLFYDTIYETLELECGLAKDDAKSISFVIEEYIREQL
jgi:hypothetical protein